MARRHYRFPQVMIEREEAIVPDNRKSDVIRLSNNAVKRRKE